MLPPPHVVTEVPEGLKFPSPEGVWNRTVYEWEAEGKEDIWDKINKTWKP